ncbi:dynein heavy chain, cytosolic [Trypanosoma theileri]|uniref:Dynein heavy chain, cytosolic n=1 Tax=Trypanosoma theileri TaxID=67003 RepID=A0A1X0P5C1_9TRYP|nr:dynein heavy chain, cytosolic [Trypanosoma theileri]ORC92031.1 dynein heavy chain, cytosolic [Trypanosoma theileri]
MNRSPYRYSSNNTVNSGTPWRRRGSNHANFDYREKSRSSSSPLRRRRSIDRNGYSSFSSRENTVRDFGGKDDLDIQVERVFGSTVLSVGDIVGYELVSNDGKWMWSIGTILSFGSNGGGGSADKKARRGSGAVSSGMEPNFMSIVCWTLKADASERRPSRPVGSRLAASDGRSLRALRRRLDEIARAKSALARVLHAENVDRRLRAADAVRESLLRLDGRRWAELLALERPTATVRVAVRAVFALLRIELLAETEEEEWERQRRFIATDAFRRLLADAAAARVAGPSIPTPQININVITESKTPLPAVVELMVQWIESELRLAEARASLEKVDIQLKELQSAEEEVGLELRWRERSTSNKRGNDSIKYNSDNAGDYNDLASDSFDYIDDYGDKTAEDEMDEENDEKYIRAVVKSFSEHGRVLFVRGSDTTFVVQSSVFCRFAGRGVEPMLDSLVIHRERLVRIRDAALNKHRRVSTNTSTVNGGGRKLTHEQSNKLLDAACQIEVMYEQSFRRERLMVRELESLYEKHIQYTDAQLRLLRRSLAAKTSAAGSTNMQNTVSVMELTAAHNRVKELEETLREKEQELRNVQAKHDKAIKKVQDRLIREAGKGEVYEQTRLSVSMFQRFRLEHEEEVIRLRISSDEASQWSLLLMHELGGSKDLAIADMSQRYLQEVGSLQEELKNREKRQLKTASILKKSLKNNNWERQRQRQEKEEHLVDDEEQQSGEIATMLAVERALHILCGTDSLDTSMETLPTLQSEDRAQYKKTGKRSLPNQGGVFKRSNTAKQFSPIHDEEKDHDDVVILKDRLVEAMQERELIQEILAREQERNRLLTEEGEALRSELLQEVERHAVLEEMVKNLQGEVSAMMGSIRSASSSSDNIKGPNGENTVNRRNWQYRQRDTIAKLRAIITMYDRQLSELLEEEGLSNDNNDDLIDYNNNETKVSTLLNTSFSSLRKYLARLKEACAVMQAERDAQAADANMLESYLKTAADALENALVHDERWQPRTTKSNHTTWHCKTFPGDDWGRVINETPEALSKALVHDIVSACHLPDEYVLNLTYSDEGSMLRVSFDLRHDPSITAEEIVRRLNECNFYQLEKLYARRFAPEEGIDTLRRELREKNEEMRRLREVISRLRNGSSASWSTTSVLSSLDV